MCDSEIPNLIDLSIEDEIQHKPGSETGRLTNSSISNTIPSTATDVFNSLPPGTPLFMTERHDSLDNNPFDCAQKLVDRPDDPFEIVEKEACYKARHSMMPPTAEVKLANLLSLSDDNLLDDLSSPNCDSPACTTSNIHKFGSNSTMASTGSTIYHSAIAIDLDNESPPISMSMKSTPDSGNSGPESFVTGSASSTDGSGGISSKNKKALEYRRRLLKLSIANSTFNSPVSRHMSIQSEAGVLSAIFAQCADHMLASESPLKLVDDDEGTSEDQPKFVHSEKDFDADLEMLKIPILKELPSPIITESTSSFTVRSAESSSSSQNNETTTDNMLPDLAAIRAKLRAKREEATNNQDISDLIQNLKSLISNINVGDDHKKRKANSLLETLSSTLACSSTENSKESNLDSPLPQPIVRQGTFDIELQENDQKVADDMQNVSLVSGETTQSVRSTSPIQEIPDAMIKSSATYDGEGVEEREGLILPIVEPLSSPSSPTPPITSPHDVNAIIEQLSKLLEQHQISTQCENADGFATAQSQPSNPTFIVVMNTTQIPQHNDADNSYHDISPDSVIANAMRRRSQSLSIHDKVKIVQIPMRPPTPAKLSLKEVSPPITTPPSDADTPEFKTPSRMMMRRNSFSSGTPYTTRMSSNYLAAATTTKRTYGNSDASRRLSTHHEGQHSVLRRPMNFPHTNLNSHKPNLKKKVKTNADSIMKSSLPLKATMPLKKVAPSLRTSPPTPESVSGTDATISHKPPHNLNSSIHLLAKSGIMSHTSTPMPPLRSAGTLNVATGYPNACSTPTGAHNTTPLKRTGAGTNKPRYSYNSITPTAKQSASASAASTGLKRRTLNEFKAKSPIKSRLSHTTATEAANGIKTSSRTSMRLQSDAPRTTNRTAASATTSNSRIVSSRLNTRASINHNAAINKNKENKYP